MPDMVSEARPASVGPHHVRTTCRVCGSDKFKEVLDLGVQPLANALLRGPGDFASERSFPLGLHVCRECGLVQLLDVIDPSVLFADYPYVTGTSETIAAHNRKYADELISMLGLGREHLVVEAASNDGSLLACFRNADVRVIGVEPAENIAALARSNGVPTESVFFSQREAVRLRDAHGPATSVIGNNVLAHVDDPVDFLTGMASLLTPDGLAVVEVPYLGDMLDALAYDTVYHEHLSYFSISALLRLCTAAGLRAVRIDRVMVHGGSLRLYAATDAGQGHDPEVVRMARGERLEGSVLGARLEEFAVRVRAHRESFRGLIEGLVNEGQSVAGYGAPAKCSTLLNFCGIGSDILPWTVDLNPLKVGRLLPGMHIPVLPVETVLERQPDYLVILPWNFLDEIMRQQQEYGRRGGRFILPIPEPRIV